MLLLIGLGVIFFIVGGVNWASMEKLLQEGDYTRTKKKTSSITGVVSTVYWCVELPPVDNHENPTMEISAETMPDNQTNTESPQPKKRGRKSKTENKKAEAEQTEIVSPNTDEPTNTDVVESEPQELPAVSEISAETEDIIPEATLQTEPSTGETFQLSSLNKIIEPNQTEETDDLENFFKADEPDFIVLEDIPEIPMAQPQEDGLMMNSNDYHINNENTDLNYYLNEKEEVGKKETEQAFDFGDLLTGEGVLEIMPESRS